MEATQLLEAAPRVCANDSTWLFGEVEYEERGKTASKTLQACHHAQRSKIDCGNWRTFFSNFNVLARFGQWLRYIIYAVGFLCEALEGEDRKKRRITPVS